MGILNNLFSIKRIWNCIIKGVHDIPEYSDLLIEEKPKTIKCKNCKYCMVVWRDKQWKYYCDKGI